MWIETLDIFPQEKFQLASAERMAGGNMMNLSAMEQTRKLANTLAENNDPKFQVDILYYDFSILFISLSLF